MLRVITREYMEYLRAIEKLGLLYEECPLRCEYANGTKYDINRNRFCDRCPRKRQREIFKRQTTEYCQIKTGVHMGANQFEDLEIQMHLIASLEDAEYKTLPVKSARMLDVYITERKRAPND